MYRSKPIPADLLALIAGIDRVLSCAGLVGSDDPSAIDRTVQAYDDLQAARDRAMHLFPSQTSPALRYRKEIMGYSDTAGRLRELVLHLFNHSNPANLGQLLWHANDHHRAIAVDLIESYSRNGENDPHFMALAIEAGERIAEDRLAMEEV